MVKYLPQGGFFMLKINNANFFSNRKIKLCAAAMSLLMLGTATSCSTNSKVEESTTLYQTTKIESTTDLLFQLKKHLIEIFDNIVVEINDKSEAFVIKEYDFIEEPIYDVNKYNNKYVVGYKTVKSKIREYMISYDNAKSVDMYELLESKVEKQKVK